ncbi:hypothetical protein [Corynebacterium bovis]|uniref:Uncharacterized protein n=2 Tax=Corynebacterium bovis TaxID=36808 RepID=A0A426PZ76_9CORY|nr:hypothetical protein [Corynebacterium bovis]MDN8578571.1 hypothetical protein [Corynebacterium bovis]RRO86625.1 hypothetical protein CXF48_06365 [Corynebacterium bovis]RRO89556.1 hypothetical protein CXF30_02960 [Corynebacterium bovis]
MPAMMPTPGRPDPRDRNRAVRVWTEGDGVPTAVTVATVLLLLVSVLLLIMGVVLWTVDRPEGVDAAHREYIRNRSVNMRVVGTVQIIGALALAWLAPSVRRGDARRRRWTLAVAAVMLFFTLAAFLFALGAAGQAVIAVVLAAACLAMYRPSVTPYFRRPAPDAEPDGDGHLPGDARPGRTPDARPDES